MMRYSMFFAIVLSLGSLPADAAPGSKEVPKPSSERLRKLQKERVEALKEQLLGQFERVKIGKDPLIQFLEAVRELAEAELDLAENSSQRIDAVDRMVQTLHECEKDISNLVNAGLQTKQGLAQARAARLKAEIQLEKLKLAK